MAARSLSRLLAAFLLAVVSSSGCASPAGGQKAAASSEPESVSLARHYRKGERLHYLMRATDTERSRTVSYQAHADGIVDENPKHEFYELFDWWGLAFDGHAMTIPPSFADFRQILSLDPRFQAPFPDLHQAYPGLIGPVLDFMTFYADLNLAYRNGGLHRPGDHFYFKFGKPNSWAAAQHLLIGEDSIDFDVKLESVDSAAHTATLLVRHVPPDRPEVRLPAAWMRQPVADTKNNWVQVGENKDGTFTAAVGKETFDDEIKISLTDGRILSAKMDNPIQVLERKCSDAALTKCDAPVRYEIRRQVEIQ